MIGPTSLDSKLAIDSKDIGALKQAARDNSPAALKAAAKQFEALFMNMVMKSMREATPQEGLFDSDQSRMYTSMLDQQISQNMASRGVGLADALLRQLTNGAAPADFPAIEASLMQNTAAPASSPGRAAAMSSNVQTFQERLSSHAEEASRTTGIPAKFMLGQAALETGWGKHEIMAADGSRSHNLFNIKATGGWKGKVVEAATTEYINGVPQTRVEKFRAYDSYADAFRDYANLLRNNPRYETVLANASDAAGFAQGLQRAGYATDPNYAAKLTKIINQSLST
ncbi:MAG: flgJ [Paucimonas sp.]|jgi:flagellar protein FlgJ|nr:flgJ [Paucimonas sp.]